jgi:archaellum component FlaC
MDQELIAYLDKRFDELNQQLGGVDERLGRVDERLGGVDERLGGVDERLGGVDERLGGVDERLGGVDERLGGVDQRLGGVDERMDGLDAAIRANGVQIEGLRGLIQKVAEGVAANNERLDAFRTDVNKQFDEMRQLFNTSHSNLHRRVSTLEAQRPPAR